MDVDAKLNEGRDLHVRGLLDQAGQAYRAVLDADPDNVDALTLSSVLTLMGGDAELAADQASRAIRLEPGWAPSYVALGNAHQAAGRLEGAVEAYRHAIALRREAPEVYVNLASALNELGRHAEASKAAVEAVVIDPGQPDAHNNFGAALLGMDNFEEAVDAFQKAVFLRQDWDGPWFNMGQALAGLGRHEEALAVYRRSISLADGADKHYCLGNSLRALGRLAEAGAEYRAALALARDHVDALANLAVVAYETGALDEAEASLRQALSLAPEAADLHWSLALVLLVQGRWREAWPHYEWRWKLPAFAGQRRDFARPEWDGTQQPGKTILVTAEAGVGTLFLFARLIPTLARQGAQVVVEAPPGAERLLTTLDGVSQVVPLGPRPTQVDLTVPWASLAHRLGLDSDLLPGPTPYLSVPAGAADFADIAALPGIRVGVVWAAQDGGASARPADFQPLQAMGLTLVSLQTGTAASQAAELPGVVDLSARMNDWADMAAAIKSVDMVLAVDGPVVHLAGALRHPVCVLLARGGDGLPWLVGRDDTPWYPSLRVFRQQVDGDWSAPVLQVCEGLAR